MKTSKRVNFIVLVVIIIIMIMAGDNYNYDADWSHINTSDLVWMLLSTSFVFIMTPGLAFFYGGMVNSKNIVSTMLQSFVCLGVVSILWILVAFSLAFGESIGGFIGNPTTFFSFRNVGLVPNNDFAESIPFIVFALFQMKFAIITPAIITGSFAERIRFRSYLLFITLFVLLIYCPLAHMTWHPDGILRNYGVLDFAGGTVVHMSAGIAALAGALFLGSRTEKVDQPTHIPYVILGTSLLWFGWFGFNAGSALGANVLSVTAFLNTTLASATGMITWIFFDHFLNKKMTALGACLGAIVGLVGITPACGFVSLSESIFIGALTAIICNLAIGLHKKIKIDDTLDVFPSHGVGGIVGMILTGVFAHEVGLIYGETETFFHHIIALILLILFIFSGSWFLYYLVNQLIPLRVSIAKELRGLDDSQHGENL